MAQNVQSLGAGGLYGTLTTYGGGGLTQGRDALDYARLGSPGRLPEAEYPDGYLGASRGQREDKLLDKVGSLNKRAYTRGVHKGERIDPGDYEWPSDQSPKRGLRNQARGVRTGLVGSVEPRLVHNGVGRPAPETAQVTAPIDAHHMSQLQSLRPAWK